MMLLTKAIKRRMPKYPVPDDEDHRLGDMRIQVKFFTPWGDNTWYVLAAEAVLEDGTGIKLSEMDARDDVVDVRLWGLAKTHFWEWGTVWLSDLASVRGPWGLKVERDMHLGNTTLRKERPDLAGRYYDA